ncbi:MAG: DUF350 domain-containing protein [Planctomycetota bacterium]|nr:MAG: DUF350 domain-containing protein [Planctomycetota bacterium]
MNKKLLVAILFAVAAVIGLGHDTLAQAAPAAAEAADKPTILQGIWGLVVGLAMALVALLISLGLAMYAIKLAIKSFDTLTKDIDEQAELKKGNMAVGILLAAVIYAIANVISSGVAGLTKAIHPELSWSFVIGVVVGLLNLVIGIKIATFTVSLAIKVLDKITTDIDEMKEVQKGNAAVAVVIAGVLISVSFIIREGVEGISSILSAQNIASVLHVDSFLK